MRNIHLYTIWKEIDENIRYLHINHRDKWCIGPNFILQKEEHIHVCERNKLNIFLTSSYFDMNTSSITYKINYVDNLYLNISYDYFAHSFEKRTVLTYQRDTFSKNIIGLLKQYFITLLAGIFPFDE
jgi:hypothetical protein